MTLKESFNDAIRETRLPTTEGGEETRGIGEHERMERDQKTTKTNRRPPGRLYESIIQIPLDCFLKNVESLPRLFFLVITVINL